MTPAEYLAKIPAERRKELQKVRQVIKENLPKGYKEMVDWGVLTYAVPLTAYPDTYNGRPLNYVALGAHKSFLTLYLFRVFGDPERRKALEAGFKKAGKRLDMGGSCVHFHAADDLPLELIGESVSSTPMAEWIEIWKKARPKKKG